MIFNKFCGRDNKLITYRLKTVTYGTASALFLAARTLQQLVLDEQHNYPLALKLKIKVSYYWTDSTIVLSWIRSSSSSFKTFVENRVTELQTVTSPDDWRHVRTDVNPADVNPRSTHHGGIWEATIKSVIYHFVLLPT